MVAVGAVPQVCEEDASQLCFSMKSDSIKSSPGLKTLRFVLWALRCHLAMAW